MKTKFFRINTGWRKSHFTKKQFNISTDSLDQEADFFTNNRGMFTL